MFYDFDLSVSTVLTIVGVLSVCVCLFIFGVQFVYGVRSDYIVCACVACICQQHRYKIHNMLKALLNNNQIKYEAAPRRQMVGPG